MFGRGMEKREFMNNNSKIPQHYLYIIIGLGVLLIILVVVLIIVKKEKCKKIIILFVGIVLGSIITIAILLFTNKLNQMNIPNMPEDRNNIKMENMQTKPGARPEDENFKNEPPEKI